MSEREIKLQGAGACCLCRWEPLLEWESACFHEGPHAAAACPSAAATVQTLDLLFSLITMVFLTLPRCLPIGCPPEAGFVCVSK